MKTDKSTPASWRPDRMGAQCKRCGGTGGLIALLRENLQCEYTFRCSCPIGEQIDVRAPRWSDDVYSPRYRMLLVSETALQVQKALANRKASSDGGAWTEINEEVDIDVHQG